MISPVTLPKPFSISMTLWIVDSTTSSIHHDVSQHVQVQRMLPLKLVNLKTCAPFMKNSSSNLALASSLTFFISAAVEPFGCSVDESVCVFSSQRIGLSSRIRMPSSTCKRDIMVLTVSCFLLLARSKARCAS